MKVVLTELTIFVKVPGKTVVHQQLRTLQRTMVWICESSTCESSMQVDSTTAPY